MVYKSIYNNNNIYNENRACPQDDRFATNLLSIYARTKPYTQRECVSQRYSMTKNLSTERAVPGHNFRRSLQSESYGRILLLQTPLLVRPNVHRPQTARTPGAATESYASCPTVKTRVVPPTEVPYNTQ